MMIDTPAAAAEFALSWINGDPAVPWAKRTSALRAIREAASAQERILALSCTPRHSSETRALVRATRRQLVAMHLFAEMTMLESGCSRCAGCCTCADRIWVAEGVS